MIFKTANVIEHRSEDSHPVWAQCIKKLGYQDTKGRELLMRILYHSENSVSFNNGCNDMLVEFHVTTGENTNIFISLSKNLFNGINVYVIATLDIRMTEVNIFALDSIEKKTIFNWPILNSVQIFLNAVTSNLLWLRVHAIQHYLRSFLFVILGPTPLHKSTLYISSRHQEFRTLIVFVHRYWYSHTAVFGPYHSETT